MKIQTIKSNLTNNYSFCRKNNDKNYLSYLNTLENEDRNFIISHQPQNKYYTPQEYAQSFIYLKSLEAPDEKTIIRGSSESRNTSADNLLKINPYSIDASYLEIIFELIQKGKLNSYAARCIKDDASINRNLKKDIDLYCDVILKNKDPKRLDKELSQAYIKTFKGIKSAHKKTKIGDVFKLKDEEYIRIKTSENKSKKLHITKETYEQLFPLFDRFATTQQKFGDCYIIEPLLILYSNPKQRHRILELFSEDKEGNLKIKFPKSKFETVFENKSFPKEEIKERYPLGADGYSFIEYAWGNVIKKESIEAAKNRLTEEEYEVFENFLEINGEENIFIAYLPGFKQKEYTCIYDTFSNAKNSGTIDFFNNKIRTIKKPDSDETFVEFLIGHGGDYKPVMKTLGYKSYFPKNKHLIKFLLNSKTFMEKHVALLSIDKHVYSVELKENSNKEKQLVLYNPHQQAFPTIISAQDLIDSAEKIRFFY